MHCPAAEHYFGCAHPTSTLCYEISSISRNFSRTSPSAISASQVLYSADISSVALRPPVVAVAQYRGSLSISGSSPTDAVRARVCPTEQHRDFEHRRSRGLHTSCLSVPLHEHCGSELGAVRTRGTATKHTSCSERPYFPPVEANSDGPVRIGVSRRCRCNAVFTSHVVSIASQLKNVGLPPVAPFILYRALFRHIPERPCCG